MKVYSGITLDEYEYIIIKYLEERIRNHIPFSEYKFPIESPCKFGFFAKKGKIFPSIISIVP